MQTMSKAQTRAAKSAKRRIGRSKARDRNSKPQADSSKPVVGIIGLGIMGSAMAANTVRAGHTVIGYDVDAARVRDHVRAGGIAARGSADVRRRSDIVICSLPSAAALAQVASELAESDGARVVVETSTMPIAVKVAAQQRLAESGVTLLDCPLSGTGSQAKVRDIVVYASGPLSAYREVAPVMDAFARAHYYVGLFGAGSKTKFVANLLVAIHNVAAAEGLVLAMKAGLDPALTLKVIADGGGSSRMLQVRGPMMVRGDYSTPTMKLDVWHLRRPRPSIWPQWLRVVAPKIPAPSVPSSRRWQASTVHRLHGGAEGIFARRPEGRNESRSHTTQLGGLRRSLAG
jgi:3-hydroxyisobutyrate dehydrogenase-like beta-hydroxyacid dehydrogenase